MHEHYNGHGSINLEFPLTVQTNDEEPLELSISPGQTLFVLGANGTGKSGLLQQICSDNPGTTKRILAQRQMWFGAGIHSLSPAQKRQIEDSVLQFDRSDQSRYTDQHGQQRPSIAILNVIEAENARARKIANAMGRGDEDLARRLTKAEGPIAAINGILRSSNLSIALSVHEHEQVMAAKPNSEPYDIGQLSDGERSAILLAAEVLTAKPSRLVIIDEPDRHLHPSIISPLLTLLIGKRPDCAFVVSTHDVTLPLDNPNARTLLLRSCEYHEGARRTWDADLMLGDSEIGEDIKRDILGSRRKMLFVEGAAGSLDKALYSILFPSVSVISKASCKDVERAVLGIRDAADLHWIDAFGIIDKNGRSADETKKLKGRGVFAISAYSVESLYYHPAVQIAATERLANVTGDDAKARVADAKKAALAAVASSVQNLSEGAALRVLRDQTFKNLPGKKEIAAGKPINITLHVANAVRAERRRLNRAIREGRLEFIIRRYPVRETSALNHLAKTLGFKDRRQYESAVRQLLSDDEETLEFIRSLTGGLADEIGK